MSLRVRISLFFLGVSLVFSPAGDAQKLGGMSPLRPPKGAKVSKMLRAEPKPEAPIIRELIKTDTILLLRSKGPWYEVDVETEEGLSFQGWIKSQLPAELTPPPATPRPKKDVTASKGTADALKSNRFVWFWDGKAEETWSFRPHIGLQRSNYKLTGTFNSGVGTVYDFTFNGIAIGFETDFNIMQTSLFGKLVQWDLYGEYLHGLYQVTLANDFTVTVGNENNTELAGSGYDIATNTYLISTNFKITPAVWDGGFVRVGLGAGFYFHELSPDLRPLTEGALAGQLLFTDLAIYGITTPVRITVQPKPYLAIDLRVHPLLLASFNETPEGTTGDRLRKSGFPLLISGLIEGYWAQHWGAHIKFNWLLSKGQNTGTSNNIASESFSDGKITFTHMDILAGVTARF